MLYLPTIFQTNQHMIQKSWSNLAVKKMQLFAGPRPRHILRKHFYLFVHNCCMVLAFFHAVFPTPWLRSSAMNSLCWLDRIQGFNDLDLIQISSSLARGWPGGSRQVRGARSRGQEVKVWPGKVHNLTHLDPVSKFHWNIWNSLNHIETIDVSFFDSSLKVLLRYRQ
jgi:hypothetical protein